MTKDYFRVALAALMRGAIAMGCSKQNIEDVLREALEERELEEGELELLIEASQDAGLGNPAVD